MHTRKPRLAAAIAVARPMPRLPPVMAATLSVIDFPPRSDRALLRLQEQKNRPERAQDDLSRQWRHDTPDAAVKRLLARVDQDLIGQSLVSSTAAHFHTTISLWISA